MSEIENEEIEVVEAFGNADGTVSSATSSENGDDSGEVVEDPEKEDELAHLLKSPSSNALEAVCERTRSVQSSDAEESDNEDDATEKTFSQDDYEDVLGTGDLWKKTINPPVSDMRPTDGQWVTISVICPTCAADNVQNFEFPLGYGYVLDAWELIVKLMSPGEVVAVKSAARFAYGDVGRGTAVRKGEQQEYEIKLVKIGEKIDFESSNAAEFLNILKNRAVEFFRIGFLEKAVQINRRALATIEKDLDSDPSYNDIKVKLLSNQALCFFQLLEPYEGMVTVLSGLQLQPDNKKLLFKKAQFHSMRKDFKDAVAVLKKLISAGSDDIPFLQKELKTAEAGLKDQLEKEKQVYKRMLGVLGKPATPRKRLPVQQKRFVWTPARKYLLLTFVFGAISVFVYAIRVALGYDH
uniref:peptidylprolyl isomerase n=1 Tax=Panagrellus redivivus TaxID=6233 RepID=A0A7E4VU36_PANRE